eukprot:g23816.t1
MGEGVAHQDEPVVKVEEYFPLGPLSTTSQSFLRLHGAGEELFVMRCQADETHLVAVAEVEEHCRHANVGVWGWIFRLKHSVLAVRLKSGEEEDLLYLDKNADVGVSWRKAGPFERFPEAPRNGYGFDVDVSLQETNQAQDVTTHAFHETQEVSNCQHFVRESLEELSCRGHLQAEGPMTLRNQSVADGLHYLGYLDEQRKALSSSPVQLQRLWASVMSWNCKLSMARWGSSWAECFYLKPVPRACGAMRPYWQLLHWSDSNSSSGFGLQLQAANARNPGRSG